jgi:hypothetical protein
MLRHLSSFLEKRTVVASVSDLDVQNREEMGMVLGNFRGTIPMSTAF